MFLYQHFRSILVMLWQTQILNTNDQFKTIELMHITSQHRTGSAPSNGGKHVSLQLIPTNANS